MPAKRATPLALYAVVAVAAGMLLSAERAHGACSVAQTGTLIGQPGVYTETLRPGQRTLRFTVPPVCKERSGMRAVACETVAAAEDAPGDDIGGDGGDAPLVELDGRQVAVTRNADADGFAMLSVELYCATSTAEND